MLRWGFWPTVWCAAGLSKPFSRRTGKTLVAKTTRVSTMTTPGATCRCSSKSILRLPFDFSPPSFMYYLIWSMVLYITHLILFTCMDVNWKLSIEREQNPGRLQNGRHAEKNLESRWSVSRQPGISGTRLNQFTTKPGAQPSRVIIPQGVFMWLISSDHLESSRHTTGGVANGCTN